MEVGPCTKTDTECIGIVVDDPEFKGRCKVQIFGKTDTIPTENLPFYSPKNSSIFAGGKSKGGGSLSVPKIDSLVQVVFQDEDENIYNAEYTVLQNLNQAMVLEMGTSYENAHTLLYDEDEKTKIMYTKDKGLILFKNGSIINIDKNNDIWLQHSDGLICIKLKSDGELTMVADDKIWLNSPQVNVGHIGSHPIPKGDMLFKLLKALATIIDAKLVVNPAATTLVNSMEALVLSSQGYVGD